MFTLNLLKRTYDGIQDQLVCPRTKEARKAALRAQLAHIEVAMTREQRKLGFNL